MHILSCIVLYKISPKLKAEIITSLKQKTLHGFLAQVILAQGISCGSWSQNNWSWLDLFLCFHGRILRPLCVGLLTATEPQDMDCLTCAGTLLRANILRKQIRSAWHFYHLYLKVTLSHISPPTCFCFSFYLFF